MSRNITSATLRIHRKPWDGILLYHVSHNAIEANRYERRQDHIRYDFAMADVKETHARSIELIQYNHSLNNQPLSALSDQVIMAMQAALYPYRISLHDGCHGELLNFDYITREWDRKKDEILIACEYHPAITKLVGRMERSLSDKTTFWNTVTRDLLFQCFFLPVYEQTYYQDGLYSNISLELHNDILGRYKLDGELSVLSVQEDSCSLSIKAGRQLRSAEELSAINTLLSHHYDPALIGKIFPEVRISIEQKIDIETGRVMQCFATFELTAGNYWMQKDELSIYYGGMQSAITDAETAYQTTFLKQEPEIIF